MSGATDARARAQAKRLDPVPDPRANRRTARQGRVFFVQVAKNTLGPRVGTEGGSKELLGARRRRDAIACHDSSLPSSPCQRRSRLRRDARIAARPAWVTAK